MPSFEYKRLNFLDNLELFSSENESDYFPFHYHDFYCVSLITNGTEILNNQQQEFIAPVGSISVTQLNEVHRNYSLAESGYSYQTLYLSKSLLEYYSGQEVNALERVIENPALFSGLSRLLHTGHEAVPDWERCLQALTAYAIKPSEKNL